MDDEEEDDEDEVRGRGREGVAGEAGTAARVAEVAVGVSATVGVGLIDADSRTRSGRTRRRGSRCRCCSGGELSGSGSVDGGSVLVAGGAVVSGRFLKSNIAVVFLMMAAATAVAEIYVCRASVAGAQDSKTCHGDLRNSDLKHLPAQDAQQIRQRFLGDGILEVGDDHLRDFIGMVRAFILDLELGALCRFFRRSLDSSSLHVSCNTMLIITEKYNTPH